MVWSFQLVMPLPAIICMQCPVVCEEKGWNMGRWVAGLWNWNPRVESFHSCSYANVSIQFLYNYSASRSHSNLIPHHSNSIPVNPEVYRIPYKVAQFLTLSLGKSSFNTSLSVSHHQFNYNYIVSFGLSSCAFLVTYLTFELWLTRVHTS